MKYMVVIEEGETSFGAHAPDLPGCIAVGETREEVLELIKGAIELHIEGLIEAGEPVPPSSSASEVIELSIIPSGLVTKCAAKRLVATPTIKPTPTTQIIMVIAM